VTTHEPPKPELRPLTSDFRPPTSGLTRNFVYAAASSGSAVLLLAVLLLAARRLSVGEFGQFSFAVALATIGESLMDWGLHQVAIRSVAREHGAAGNVFRNSIALKFVPSLVMVVVLTLIGAWVSSDTDVRVLCALLAVSAVMRSYLLTIRGVLQGLERFSWDAAVVLLDRLLLVALSAIVLFSGGRLVALGWSFVGARTIALAVSFGIVRGHVGSLAPTFDRELWRDLGQRALPIGAFLILLNLYSYVDTVMLMVMRGDVETGLYSGAYRIYEGAVYGAAVLSAVLTPRLSSEFVRDKTRFAWLARMGLLASIGMAAVLGLAIATISGPLLARLFHDPSFATAARALQILCLGLLVTFPIWILQAVAIATSTERVLWRTTAIGVIINVAANLFLIPVAGRDGAALATVIGETVNVLLLLQGLGWALRRGTA
jgi:O-antigen/teichoic acid export membrane protein